MQALLDFVVAFSVVPVVLHSNIEAHAYKEQLHVNRCVTDQSCIIFNIAEFAFVKGKPEF